MSQNKIHRCRIIQGIESKIKGYYHDKTLCDGEIDVDETKYANAVSVTKQGIIVYSAEKDQKLINLLFSYFDAETDVTLFDD